MNEPRVDDWVTHQEVINEEGIMEQAYLADVWSKEVKPATDVSNAEYIFRGTRKSLLEFLTDSYGMSTDEAVDSMQPHGVQQRMYAGTCPYGHTFRGQLHAPAPLPNAFEMRCPMSGIHLPNHSIYVEECTG